MSLSSRVRQASSVFMHALLAIVVWVPAVAGASSFSTAGDKILVDNFEQPDLESRWDVMGAVERAEDAALFERWGIRFGERLNSCIDCGGDPDVICGNLAAPEPSGHLSFWVDYSRLQMNGSGTFNLVRLLAKSTEGPAVLTVEHKFASGNLWVRIVGWGDAGPVASSLWAPLGSLDGSLQGVGFQIYWGPSSDSTLRGNLEMSLAAYDAVTDTWPVVTATLRYSSQLTSYKYMVLGIDRETGRSGIAGSLDIDDVELRRSTQRPLLGQ